MGTFEFYADDRGVTARTGAPTLTCRGVTRLLGRAVAGPAR